MHIEEKDGTAVLTIRSNDDTTIIQDAVAKELYRGFRVNAFDGAISRSLIFSVWKTPAGYGVRRGIVAGRFPSAHVAAADAVLGLEHHFDRPEKLVMQRSRA